MPNKIQLKEYSMGSGVGGFLYNRGERGWQPQRSVR